MLSNNKLQTADKILIKTLKDSNQNFIKKIDASVRQERENLKSLCVVCGNNESIEIHQVLFLKKKPCKNDFS